MTLRPRRPRTEGGGDAFDLWLKRSIHETYDPVLDEQVPDDLLRLFSDNRTEWEAMKERWLKLERPRPGT